MNQSESFEAQVNGGSPESQGSTFEKPDWYGEVSLTNAALQTPMMQQFISIKRQVPDALLLFRMGDFYELFLNDAVVAGRVLDLNVTSRNKKDPEPIPMAGIPHHAVEGYLPRLAQAGYKVAIAEQQGDPAAKKMLERQLTRIVTPGVPWDADALESKESYWLVGFYAKSAAKGPYAVVSLDVSTGEMIAVEFAKIEEARAEIMRLQPREIIALNSLSRIDALETLFAKVPHSFYNKTWFDLDEGYQNLCHHFKVSNLNGFGVRASDGIVGAAAALLTYVRDVTYTDLSHVRSIQRYTVAAQMMIDEATKMNLEILEPQKGTNKQNTLIHLLDRTKTAMGGRLLKKWVSAPLVDLGRIQRRQDAVEAMLDEELRSTVQSYLQSVYDLERLSGKLAQLSIHPKALLSLGQSILLLPEIFELLKNIDAFKGFIPDAVPTEMAQGLLSAIDENAPITINEGGIFKKGYNAELDELRKLTNEVKMAIAELEDAQREATGIASLKVKHNRVFGYFLEVTTANKDRVPDDWIRKQTLSNAERYVTPSLKEFEEKILTSGERAKALEQKLFSDLREEASQFVLQLQKLAQRISYVDVFCSLAEVAVEHRYCRPTVDLSLNISLRQSRHPIIEHLSMLETFIPNDVQIDSNKRQILLTGPNMSGKSTIMRQVALTVLMAQMGSFVPADSAHIGLCDTIFVRVGASDDLAEGRSTFMVEMSETAYILNQATEQSLLLLDEIGRGTSTYDGMSIAWAVAEAIHDKIKARCIFATHYHELTRLNDTCEHIHNMHVAIQEDRGEIRFLRVLQDGAIGKSYGIQCARLAGLPRTVIRRATQILKDLEVQALQDREVQLALFTDEESSEDSSEETILVPDYLLALADRLHDLPLDDHSPFEALKELYELQKIIRQERAR